MRSASQQTLNGLREMAQLVQLETNYQSTSSGLPPLFPWPGGKRWLLSRLRSLIPLNYHRYFEPFLGGGALYFALGPPRAQLSDKNDDLIECFRQVRDCPEAMATRLAAMPRDEQSYYKIRSEVPVSAEDRAARLVYLTTLAFNGIYRVNLAGQFNVPYGRRQYGDGIWCLEKLRLYSETLRTAELVTEDFEGSVSKARPGDLIYFDPPYTVTHNNNGFVKYNDKIFSWRDQERLADVARDLDKRGCHVLVSNAFHPALRDLYGNFQASVVHRTSMMAADISKRRPIQEYIFSNVR